MEASVSLWATVLWDKPLRRHPSLHAVMKYLLSPSFVLAAEDVMIYKNTHNLCTPGDSRPVGCVCGCVCVCVCVCV